MERLIIENIQWSRMKDLDEMERLNDRDHACMRDMRDVLKKHGALDRFGITLLHKHFELAPDECLVEYIDPKERTLLTKPEKIAGLDWPNVTETQWTMTDGSAVQVCNRRCFPGSTESPQHVNNHAAY